MIDWTNLLDAVPCLFEKYADAAYAVMAENPKAPFWMLPTEEVGMLFIKRAGETPAAVEPPLKAVADAYGAAQVPFGGPHPLAASLVSGALGAGLGYGGGWLASKLFSRYFDEDEAPKRMALLGGILGAVPPMAFYGMPMMERHGLKGLIMGGPYGPGAEEYAKQYPPYAPASTDVLGTPGGLTSGTKTASYQEMTEKLAATMGYDTADDPMMQRAAGAGGGYLPSIDVDAYGRIILPNPYMSEQAKAVAVGFPLAASMATGSSLISPMDVAKIGVGMGLGAAYGGGLGWIAQEVMGLKPQFRDDLQVAGAIAGAVKAVTGFA